MERFPVELLYVLAFVGIIFFNYIAQKAARRRREEEEALAASQPQPQAEPAPEEALDEDIWGRAPTPPPAPLRAAVAAPVLAPRPAVLAVHADPHKPRAAHPVRALLRNRGDLRRAIVLMTVLGPCRAMEPPDRDRR